MRTIRQLAEIRPWALAAEPGEEKQVRLSDTITTQEDASKLAGTINQERGSGHVWLEVKAPNLVEARCTY